MTSAITDGGTAAERLRDSVADMADALRADGWEVQTVHAGHVTPVPPEAEEDHHGLVYVAPDGVAETLPEAVERGSFDRYEAFRHVAGDDLSLVTELRDSQRQLAVLLAGTVDRERAEPLAQAARERGVLHSHVRLLDGTHLATFRHEEPTHFFPEDP